MASMEELQRELHACRQELHKKDNEHRDSVLEAKGEVIHDILEIIRKQKPNYSNRVGTLLLLEHLIEAYRYDLLKQTYETTFRRQ